MKATKKTRKSKFDLHKFKHQAMADLMTAHNLMCDLYNVLLSKPVDNTGPLLDALNDVMKTITECGNGLMTVTYREDDK